MEEPRINKNQYSRYLIESEQDALWGLTVSTVGKQRIEPGEPYPPGEHPMRYLFSARRGRVLGEYQLLYLTQGKGTFASASCRRAPLAAGQMFLLFPGEWHTYYPDPATGWEEYWIGFKGENIDNRVRHKFFDRSTPIFNVGVLDEVVALYTQAIAVAREQKAGFQQMLAGIVNHLLGLAFSRHKHAEFEHTHAADCINQAKIVFSERFRDDIRPEAVARELHVGYSWFRRFFKEYTGFAPSQYVHELRLQHAKSLLTNTTLNAKEIAFDCGFKSPEYFFHAFKCKTGLTPLEYRKQTSQPT